MANVPGAQLDLPVCDAPAPEPNRWRILREVLGGTWESASCALDFREDSAREDFGYPIPHVEWAAGPTGADGLLRTYRHAVAFGAATFDGLASPATDAPGGFSSWYDAPAGSLGGQALDLGIRNEAAVAGALLVPPADDTLAGLQAAAERVEAWLPAIVPAWAVIPGAALADLAALVTRDPRLRDDPLQACRPRSVLFVTDGEPANDGLCGYPRAWQAAESLADQGLRTWVVAFAATPEVLPSQIERAEAAAAWGCGCLSAP